MIRSHLIHFIIVSICISALHSFAAAQPAPVAPADPNQPRPWPQSPATVERHLQVSGNPVACQVVLLRLTELQNGQGNTASICYGIMQSVGCPDDALMVTVNAQAQTVDLKVMFRTTPSNAQQTADNVAHAFAKEFTRYSEQSMDRVNRSQQAQNTIRLHIDSLRSQRDDLETQLRKSTGAVDVSPASVRERMASLQTQKESATIELAAKQARSDALALQISKFSGQIQDKVKNDPIAAELAKVVDARQSQLDREQKAPAGFSSSEVDQAMATLAEAKAKLLERQEAAANTAGGDIIAGWNRELMTLSVDIAELTARSKALDDRLGAYANADEYLNYADQWQAQIADLQKQEWDLNAQLQSAAEEYDRNHVEITMMNDSTKPSTQPTK